MFATAAMFEIDIYYCQRLANKGLGLFINLPHTSILISYLFYPILFYVPLFLISLIPTFIIFTIISPNLFLISTY